MKRLIIAFCLFSFLCFPSINAQEADQEHKISSAIFNSERAVRVFLPDRYLNDSTVNLPVV